MTGLLPLGRVAAILALLAGIASTARPAAAQSGMHGLKPLSAPQNVLPAQLEQVTVEEHLGKTIPLDLPLVDHEGRAVKLGDYFGKGRPVILNLGYYGCPMLCGLVTQGLLKGIKSLDYLPGREFDVVTVTIDPKEDTKLAAEKRASLLEDLGRPGAEKGWSFHTAAEADIERLARSVGFGYRWDEKSEEWAHAAVVVLISPEGKISRYLYGIEFSPKDLKLGLLEASEGKVGSTVDRILLYCFHYDSDSQGYVLFARNVMKLGGVLTLVSLGAFLLVQWRRSGLRSSR